MTAGYRHPTEEDIKRMVEMKNCGSKTRDIAHELGYTPRQVREAIKRMRRSQTKEWTQEEIQILIDKYKQGFKKGKDLKPFLPHKADYSIRNKIDSLKKKGQLNEDSTFIPIYLEETDSITTTEVPIVTEDVINYLFNDEGFPFISQDNNFDNNNESIFFDDNQQSIDFSKNETEPKNERRKYERRK